MIYLASPYSHPDESVREHRFAEVCRVTSILMANGNFIFSPIAHSHSIVKFGLPTDWEFWEAYDVEHIRACNELWVLIIDGWEMSKGISAEIKIAKNLNKPIKFVNDQGVLVSEVK